MLARSDIQTPRTHGQVLVVPGPDQQRAALQQAGPDGSLLERSLSDVRATLWDRLGLPSAPVVTGHQAEFIHPGVFAKSIASGLLGHPVVYLTVDSDTPKTDVLTLPRVVHGVVQPERLPIPDLDAQRPLEHQPALRQDHWKPWFDEVRQRVDVDDWFAAFVDGWMRTPAGARLPDAFVNGQRACEATLDLQHVHLSTSAMSAWPEFRAYLLQIANQGVAFAREYNAAQHAYRQRHRVRTAQRPVPLLVVEDDYVELPFWVVRTGGLRHRLGLRLSDRQLLADREAIGSLPGATWEAAEVATEAESNGWGFRPRALTLSGFSRLVLGPLFVHGIGGAKYDELTDAFTEAFFGVAPAPLACVSAALLLPLPHDPEAGPQLSAARYAQRDVRFNPQRQLRDPDAILVQRKQELIERGRELGQTQRHARAARLENHRALQRVNDDLLRQHGEQVNAIGKRVVDAQRRVHEATHALSREYFHGLFRLEQIHTLRDALQQAYVD